MKIGGGEILSIKDRWADICNEYLKKFCQKHKYNIDPYPWVGDNPGTVAMIGDLLVGMDDMRYDIDNNIPEDFFEKWYWKDLDVYELTKCHYMNYSSFCMGAPDEWSDERMDKIRKAKERVKLAEEELEKEINNIKIKNEIF